MILGNVGLFLTAGKKETIGQVEFEGLPGDDFTWVVPDGVSLISAVCVGVGGNGGGGLTWGNGCPVTAGETLYIRFFAGAVVIRRGSLTGPDLILAYNGTAGNGGQGGTSVHAPEFSDYGGGRGGNRQGSQASANAGGGGAGGYLGNGGAGGHSSTHQPTDGAGGGGGGGRGGNASTRHHGAGVGLLGIGADGLASNGATPPTGGSGGGNATSAGPGEYGGGRSGGAAQNQVGGAGGVRIMWGGGRAYPYNAGDL